MSVDCPEHEHIKSMAREAKEKADSATITLSALTEIVKMLDDSVRGIVQDLKDLRAADIAYKESERKYKDELSRARSASLVSIALALISYAVIGIINFTSMAEVVKSQATRVQCLEELHPRVQK